jgi:uncharacterized SAM-binding protein YcdF (DUF218 family)
MALYFLFLIIISSFICLIFKWQRAAITFLGTAILWILLNGTGLLPAKIISYLEVHPRLIFPSWKNNNAIILLGAGVFQWRETEFFTTHPLGISRIHEATRLYFHCKKNAAVCKILATGGDLYKKGISESKVMQVELKNLGVPIADIIVEMESRNTYENAKLSLPFISDNRFDEIVLVTSGFHMTRSLMIFSHFKIKAQAAPSDNLNFPLSPLPEGDKFHWMDIALHEYGGMVKFHLYNFLGLQY